MSKIVFKKKGWLTYLFFLTLMTSLVYYIQNFDFGGGIKSFVPAVVMWPLATFLCFYIYLNYYIGRDTLIDVSAILAIIFIFSTVLVFSGNIINLASNIINNILWFSLMMIFYHHSQKNGIEKLYIITATVTIVIVALNFMQLFNFTKTENAIKTLNPIYYCLYLVPFVMLNRNKLWQYFGMGIALITILVSNKRTALIAFALVLIFYVMRNHQESLKSVSSLFRNLLLVGLLLVGIYLVTNIILSSYAMIDWKERLQSIWTTGGGGRTERWRQFFVDVQASNFFELIFGHGFVYPYYHNDLFQVYYNFGIPGLMAYVATCMLLTMEFFKMNKTKYRYTTAYGASLIIFFFNSLVGQVIVVHTWMLQMGVFWGLILGDYRKTILDQKRNA